MSTPYGDFESINAFLATKSYVVGFIPSSADAKLASEIQSPPEADKYPHLARWYRHITSFDEGEKGKFVSGDLPDMKASAAPVPNGKKAAEKDEDSDNDLFGDDDEDDDEVDDETVRMPKLIVSGVSKMTIFKI